MLTNEFLTVSLVYTVHIWNERNRYSTSLIYTTGQWLILRDIASTSPTTLVHISKRRFIEKPTTRKIIKVLSDRELLIVEPSKEDKREKLLSLSDKGQTLYVDVYRKILPVDVSLLKMLDYLTWNLKMLFQ